ncbi:MAG: S8 family serine peptidase [Actinomycetota bacterium]
MKARAFALPLLFLMLSSRVPSPNDPAYTQGAQWGLKRIGSFQSWQRTRGSGSVVAVVDTGVDLKHPDLRGRIVTGKDFADGSGSVQDVNGHGTLIAGIVAATTNNGIGVASVAPQAKIMPIRVLGSDGTGTSTNVAEGIRWAAAHGANVINLSLAQEHAHGLAVSDALLHDPDVDIAINQAVADGLVVVVAAGNDAAGGKSQTAYESSSPGVMVVGASTNRDRRAAYSNYGSGLDILAPGGGSATDARDSGCKDPNFVVSTWWDPDHKRSAYGGACGTSMSVAFVAGVAAQLHSLGYSNVEAVARIEHTALDLGPKGFDAQSGWGRLDASRAIGAVPADAPARPIQTQSKAAAAPTPVDVEPAPPAPAGALHAQSPAGDDPRPARMPIAVAAALVAVACVSHGARAARRISRRSA